CQCSRTTIVPLVTLFCCTIFQHYSHPLYLHSFPTRRSSDLIREFDMTSEEFAIALLDAKKLAVVPGSAFGEGGEGFLRISYAYSIKELTIAMDKIEEFVTELRNK